MNPKDLAIVFTFTDKDGVVPDQVTPGAHATRVEARCHHPRGRAGGVIRVEGALHVVVQELGEAQDGLVQSDLGSPAIHQLHCTVSQDVTCLNNVLDLVTVTDQCSGITYDKRVFSDH